MAGTISYQIRQVYDKVAVDNLVSDYSWTGILDHRILAQLVQQFMPFMVINLQEVPGRDPGEHH